MATEPEERIALAVLDAEGSKEKKSRLYDTYGKSDVTKMWIRLKDDGFIAEFEGLTSSGARCLKRGYVYSDHILKEKERIAIEEKRHQETLDVAKKANEIAEESNRIARKAKGWSIAALLVSTLISLTALVVSMLY